MYRQEENSQWRRWAGCPGLAQDAPRSVFRPPLNRLHPEPLCLPSPGGWVMRGCKCLTCIGALWFACLPEGRLAEQWRTCNKWFLWGWCWFGDSKALLLRKKKIRPGRVFVSAATVIIHWFLQSFLSLVNLLVIYSKWHPSISNLSSASVLPIASTLVNQHWWINNDHEENVIGFDQAADGSLLITTVTLALTKAAAAEKHLQYFNIATFSASSISSIFQHFNIATFSTLQHCNIAVHWQMTTESFKTFFVTSSFSGSAKYCFNCSLELCTLNPNAIVPRIGDWPWAQSCPVNQDPLDWSGGC